MKRVISLSLALVLLLAMCLSLTTVTASAESKIDNSDLIPKWRPSEEVELEELNGLWSPDWIKELIMAEVRIETATEEGTFQSAVQMLDHYAEMGVNGLWVTPIYDRNSTDRFTGNGYGNYGPETVWSRLTGTTDYDEGFKVVKKFVDEAHKRNIRIFFDIVVWGTAKQAPVHVEHPEYFSGSEVWGGWGFQWGGQKFKEWFKDSCVDFILKTGADGFRCDLEPTITGYGLFEDIRNALYFDHNTIIGIISEGSNDRGATYDFEQNGVSKNHFLNAVKGEYSEYIDNQHVTVKGEPMSVVDVIKTGNHIGTALGEGGYRYYTYNLLCHDDAQRIARGNVITFGWQCIFTPFIPLWYIGEEWNNPRKGMGGTGVIYFDYIDWSAKDEPENRAYFETIKKYIRVRRLYPEIFEYYPDDHRNSNICGVNVSGVMTDLQAYARYMGEKAVLVVPNDDTNTANASITIPFAEMGMGKNAKTVYTVTDLMTGKQIVKGTASEVSKFSAKIASEDLGVYLVEGPKEAAPTTKPATKPTTKPVTSAPTSAPTTEPSSAPTTTVPETEPSTAPVTEPVTEPETQPVTEESSAADEPAAGLPVGLIVGIAAGVVVLAAAIIVIVIVSKKKK